MLLPSSKITSLVFRVSVEIPNGNQKFVYARHKIVFNFIIHSWKMRFAYCWRSRFNPPASRKIKLWIKFRNTESLFEYYEMILSVWTLSNPMKLLGRHKVTSFEFVGLYSSKSISSVIKDKDTRICKCIHRKHLKTVCSFKKGGNWLKTY